MLVCAVARSALPRLLWITHWFMLNPVTFTETAEDEPESEIRLLERHETLQEELRGLQHLHRCPTVLLGMGRASVAHKVETAAHALRLEKASHCDLSTQIKAWR